ncbi:MAG TPA: CopD family protein [Gammaproteobacteria bacterium]|nr:CopD family protein [Gammaproteobacteria bacterium]
MFFALSLHILAAIVWVGGMFFAYVCLRPAAVTLLEPSLRLRLWIAVFRRFFLFVWLAVVLLPVTGMYMADRLYSDIASAPAAIVLMAGIGTLMILLYWHAFFAPYRRLRRCVALGDFKEGGRQLARIRRIIGVNTLLGALVVLMAVAGQIMN